MTRKLMNNGLEISLRPSTFERMRIILSPLIVTLSPFANKNLR
jgi:hypothetical protein